MRVLAALVLSLCLCTSARAACTTSFTVENNTSAPPTVGQSFTAGCAGFVAGITVKADTPNAGLMTLKIYSGESLAAPDLLFSQTGMSALVNGENQYQIVPPVGVASGQQYTFLFTNESANGIKFRYDTTNGYAGGQATAGAGFVAGSDIWFRVDIIGLAVPALSEWGVLILAMLLGGIAVYTMRGRRTAC